MRELYTVSYERYDYDDVQHLNIACFDEKDKAEELLDILNGDEYFKKDECEGFCLETLSLNPSLDHLKGKQNFAITVRQNGEISHCHRIELYNYFIHKRYTQEPFPQSYVTSAYFEILAENEDQAKQLAQQEAKDLLESGKWAKDPTNITEYLQMYGKDDICYRIKSSSKQELSPQTLISLGGKGQSALIKHLLQELLDEEFVLTVGTKCILNPDKPYLFKRRAQQ